MKNIAIIGAGFTGLSAAHYLQKQQVSTTIFEKEKIPGGLASGFKQNNWHWSLESHYHHLFTNDKDAISLMKELKQAYQVLPATTSILKNSKIFRLDCAISLLQLPLLNIFEKLRVGLLLLLLKIIPRTEALENQTAFNFLNRYMGSHAFETLFKPLFTGKFGKFADKISAIWFWARIKKRTQNLIYPEGGYQNFAQILSENILKRGGKIFFNTGVEKIEKKNSRWSIKTKSDEFLFDEVIFTIPSTFLPLILPAPLLNPLSSFLSISHLDALNMIIETKKPILQKTYWLNINEENFPFLAVVQHTNLIDKKNYGGNHICYIGNYLPANHEYFGFSKEKLLELFFPYLQKINPKFSKEDITAIFKLRGKDAQPVVEVGYKKLLPPLATVPGLYLANMDMVYPWDRGINYAIEMGRKVAEIITQNANTKM